MSQTTNVRLKDLAAGRSEVFKLPLDKIAIEPGFNLRVEESRIAANVRQIADGMRAYGFRYDRPLTVQLRDGRAVIRDGHCRFAALKLAIKEGAEIDAVPCVSVPQHSGDADLVAGQMVQPGMELSPLEYAAGVKRLMNYGWTAAEVAARLGRSPQWVGNMLLADNAPGAVRQMIAAGEVSATEAVKTIRRQGAAGATETLTKARDAVRASGKKKVTAKAVKGVAAPKPALPNAAERAVNLWGASRPMRQWAKANVPDFADAMETLRETLP